MLLTNEEDDGIFGWIKKIHNQIEFGWITLNRLAAFEWLNWVKSGVALKCISGLSKHTAMEKCIFKRYINKRQWNGYLCKPDRLFQSIRPVFFLPSMVGILRENSYFIKREKMDEKIIIYRRFVWNRSECVFWARAKRATRMPRQTCGRKTLEIYIRKIKLCLSIAVNRSNLLFYISAARMVSRKISNWRISNDWMLSLCNAENMASVEEEKKQPTRKHTITMKTKNQ